MSSSGAAAPQKRRRAAGAGAAAGAAAEDAFSAPGPMGPMGSIDPLMQTPRDGLAGGGDADGDGEEEEPVPDVMNNIFKSAALSDVRAANAANGITNRPDPRSMYLRPKMNFSIVPRAPSMMSRIFEMIAAVLSRSGGREASGSIGFTVVMLNGVPKLAIDVGDERFTFVVSVRITADIYLHPDFAGVVNQFPVLRVRCRSMVEKLSQAKDFHRVILYQNTEDDDRLEVMIDTPERAGNIQHETVKIQADEWESLVLDTIEHQYTLQLTIKTLMQLCRMQRDASGHIHISIHDRSGSGSGSGSGRAGGDGGMDTEDEAASVTSRGAASESSGGEASGASAGGSSVVTRQRQEYILKLEITNAEGEESSILRPITTEIERRTSAETGQTRTTLHFCEEKAANGLELLERLPRCPCKYKQTFSSGYIEAFLSKFDPNKMITMRLAEEKPMVLSYLHGGLLVCQMVVSPVYEEDTA
jgi:hypothetical protein